jgi:hypothetical protein
VKTPWNDAKCHGWSFSPCMLYKYTVAVGRSMLEGGLRTSHNSIRNRKYIWRFSKSSGKNFSIVLHSRWNVARNEATSIAYFPYFFSLRNIQSQQVLLSILLQLPVDSVLPSCCVGVFTKFYKSKSWLIPIWPTIKCKSIYIIYHTKSEPSINW